MDVIEILCNILFCIYVIVEEEYLIVLDVKVDKLFVNNLLVIGSFFIRVYVGVILCNKDGYELGMLCLLFDELCDFLDVEIESLINYVCIVEIIIFLEYFLV